jgi:hypothetical protein
MAIPDRELQELAVDLFSRFFAVSKLAMKLKLFALQLRTIRMKGSGKWKQCGR